MSFQGQPHPMTIEEAEIKAPAQTGPVQDSSDHHLSLELAVGSAEAAQPVSQLNSSLSSNLLPCFSFIEFGPKDPSI